MNCPHCGGSTFKAYQEFDDQNHRTTIKLECINDGTIMYADSVLELSTRFPEK